MKSKMDELANKILLLIKLDAKRLFERIKGRRKEYLTTFSVKRTREHFKEVFKNRYQFLKIDDLVCCGEETIIALDEFYTLADEMNWYLHHTEDMPATVEDKTGNNIRALEKHYQTLNLYIDADLGYQGEDESD